MLATVLLSVQVLTGFESSPLQPPNIGKIREGNSIVASCLEKKGIAAPGVAITFKSFEVDSLPVNGKPYTIFRARYTVDYEGTSYELEGIGLKEDWAGSFKGICKSATTWLKENGIR